MNVDRGRQGGGASAEYVVVTTVVVSVLFAPLPGLDGSAVEHLLAALRQFQAHSTFLLSMP